MPFGVVAGAAQVLWMPEATAKLTAQVFDADADEVEWRCARAPSGCEAEFADAGNLETEVTVSGPGSYMMTCKVQGGGEEAEGSMVIEVYTEADTFGGYDVNFLRETYGGDTLLTEWDFEGLDYDRVKPAPEPYQHPRVAVNPEDMEDLIARMDTGPGKKMIEKLRNVLDKQRETSEWQERYDGGDIPDEDGFLAHVMYDMWLGIIEGDEDRVKAACGVAARMAESFLPNLMDVRKKLVRQAKHRDERVQELSRLDYRTGLQGHVHRRLFPIIYDYGYNYMDDDQRDHIRKFILHSIEDIWCIGMSALPSLDSCRSNWVTHFDQILHLCMAVEGEEAADGSIAYDQGTFIRSMAAAERYMTFGLNPDGSPYEGLGKNQTAVDICPALAKRGFWLICSKALKNHFTRYYPAHMFPWGKNLADKKFPQACFTWDESLGGTGQESRYAEIAVYKACFPNNPVLDVIYRAELQDGLARLNDFNVRFAFKALDYYDRLIYMTKPVKGKPFAGMYQECMEGQPLTYFSDYQGRLVTQSAWESKAVQFHFQPRHVRGGHAHNDRNKFIFYALKEVWLEDTGSKSTSSYLHSVVTIDENQNKPGLLPGKTVALCDTELITAATGDARAGYAAPVQEGNKKYVPFALNDTRFEKLERPFYDVPTALLPTWETGLRPRKGVKNVVHGVKDFPPKAFRTAGLVRGDHPYAFIIDDQQRYKKKEASYCFQLVIARHLCKENRDELITTEGRDVLIRANDERRCLIRFVDIADEPKFKWRSSGYTLGVFVKAVSANFKVIIYAYKEGEDPELETSYEEGKMSVKIGDQEDEFELEETEAGWTSIKFSRNGDEVMNMQDYLSPNGDKMFVPNLVDIEDTPDDPREVPREE